MGRYDEMLEHFLARPTTKMMRVVDAQGYHLRWIEVPVEEKTPEEKDDGQGRAARPVRLP